MSILLCGDISVKEPVHDIWKNGTVETLFADVADLFRSSNRVIVNLETAVTEKETAIRKFGPNIKAPLCVPGILKEAGVTDCGLSNNHTLDFDVDGIKDTIEALDKAGLNYTGFGWDEEDSRKDLIFTENGKTVRIIAVCEHEYTYAQRGVPGGRPYDPYDTHADIRKAKAEADYVIVMYHGGKEHCQYPSPRLRKLCRAMVNDGADLVLCQHSHCIGCAEEYNGGTILYGQGNFHFMYPTPRDRMWSEGLAVRVTLEDKPVVEFIPTVLTSTGIRLMHGEEADLVYSEIAERSKMLESDEWLEGWREFCERMRPGYEAAIANFHKMDEHSIHHFAHYLDCEAHTDVWRELYKTWHAQKAK